MAQSDQFHEQWEVVRDKARPVVPDDVYFLAEARRDMPPSKAHVKRLLRVRPEVTPATARPAPDHSRRREINQAHAAARVAREAIARAKRLEA